MGYQLADGVTFCITSDLVVFHDLKSDAYISLEGVESQIFRNFAETGRVGSTPLLDDLSSAGLLREAPSHFVRIMPVSSVTPDKSYLDESRDPVSIRAILSAVLAQYAAAISLRTRPLHSVIAALRMPDAPGGAIEGRQSAHVIDSAAQAFDVSTRFIASSTKCLRRSIALHRYLSGRGIDAKLVIGVKVNAFGAHCWVQYDRTVLNDSLENVLRYTPYWWSDAQFLLRHPLGYAVTTHAPLIQCWALDWDIASISDVGHRPFHTLKRTRHGDASWPWRDLWHCIFRKRDGFGQGAGHIGECRP